MPETTANLHDATPPPRRRASVAVALIYLAVLAALLQLTYVHAGDDAPLRSRMNSYTPFADIEAQLKAADADPRAAEIHFADVPPGPFADKQKMVFGRVYYTAQYLRYPHRLLVGSDDQIINNQEQLLSADQLPSEPWMKQHGVSTVYHVYDPGLIGPQMDVRPVP